MITLKYIQSCDCCGFQRSKEITFESVELLLYNPKIKTLYTPAVPHGWIIEPAKQAGKAELLFCSVQCRKEWLSKEQSKAA